ncbi:MAG TPA: UbiA family prenyltransferase, partial [Puia sp.]|nr:UbiA family prenyltransferase [Puia sp.]
MDRLRKIFNFFLFSSVYISLCSVLMTWQTSYVLRLSYSYDFFWFVFFASICSYNFHWFLTPQSHKSPDRVKWTHEHKNGHLLFYFTGVVGSIIFFIKLRHHWFALLFATLITFLYSAPKIPLPYFRFLKQVAIGKTTFLTMVWTYVTAIMPVFIAEEEHFNDQMKLFAASRFFLIYGICILFDYRDREDDKEEGIKSMITYFDEKGVNRLFVFSMIAFGVFTLGLLFTGLSLLKVFVLLVPGFILAALYSYAKRNFSDYLYYF